VKQTPKQKHANRVTHRTPAGKFKKSPATQATTQQTRGFIAPKDPPITTTRKTKS
jgi:hypothetical protein